VATDEHDPGDTIVFTALLRCSGRASATCFDSGLVIPTVVFAAAMASSLSSLPTGARREEKTVAVDHLSFYQQLSEQLDIDGVFQVEVTRPAETAAEFVDRLVPYLIRKGTSRAEAESAIAIVLYRHPLSCLLLLIAGFFGWSHKNPRPLDRKTDCRCDSQWLAKWGEGSGGRCATLSRTFRSEVNRHHFAERHHVARLDEKEVGEQNRFGTYRALNYLVHERRGKELHLLQFVHLGSPDSWCCFLTQRRLGHHHRAFMPTSRP
jgi:hypothetical protein